MLPKLSIILPVFNAEKYVGKTIQCILEQSFQDFELLIADDGSTDNSRTIVDSFSDPRIILSHNQLNLGKTSTVNRLFRQARGSYITIHDADDFSAPNRFAKQINFLDKMPDLVMCGTSFMTIDCNENILEENVMESDYEKIIQGISTKSQFHGPTMLFRKSIADKLSDLYRAYFNDNYEDTDLACRLLDYGPATNLPEKLYYYRILPNSLCRKEVNIRNRNLYKVVVFLRNQRIVNGLDCLMSGEPSTADEYFESVTEPYKIDNSLINREAAAYFLFWRMYSRAIRESLMAIKKQPSILKNWRTLFYCVRKSILR
jgi:glycosyltransferase involved in cell wall biosynthesis